MPETITEVTVEITIAVQEGVYKAVDDEDSLKNAICKQLEIHPHLYNVAIERFEINEKQLDDDDDDEEDEDAAGNL